MNLRRGRPVAGVAALFVAFLPSVPAALSAQDFLFRRPVVTVGVHGGWAMPSASSDIFDEVRESFTIGSDAFGSTTWGGEVAFRLTERLDVAAGLEYAQGSTRSEYRDVVDIDDNPIEQTTTLRRIPLTLSVRGYLFERGRTISRFAWVPNAWSPYVGAGAGYLWYRFDMEGDFVNFDDPDWPIFTDRLRSDGTAPTAHVLAGIEASLTERFLLRGEYRHSWASSDLDTSAFSGYDPIDLGGGRATIGVAVRM